MTTITSTGNFLARPNIHTELGLAVEYHFHNFAHTVLPLSGLWKVTVYDNPDGDEELNTNVHTFIGEAYIAPKLFAATYPDLEIHPWAVIQPKRFHQIELISKIMSVQGQQIGVDECEFWCCWSFRDPSGEIIEYPSGYEAAFS
jgi:hypothetical protein